MIILTVRMVGLQSVPSLLTAVSVGDVGGDCCCCPDILLSITVELSVNEMGSCTWAVILHLTGLSESGNESIIF